MKEAMKNTCKYLLASLLAVFARAVVRRYRPRIVMVTGSVGKTSTKDAVAAVLSTRFFVRKSAKSFNSELGVPFTILGVENPWTDALAWLLIFKSALALLLLPNHYPNLLVLEVGADKPGDLARILKIATPDAVVVTKLPEIPVHVEAYASPEAVREEEFAPAHALRGAAPLIVSTDDPYALDHALRTPARVMTFGVADNALVHVSNIDFYTEEGKVAGMQADIGLEQEKGRCIVKGSVGRTQIWPAAAALAAGHAFGVSLADSLAALGEYVPPPGRGRLFVGVNGSVIIDDSYNASPTAVEEALATLKAFPATGRKIAVLGDMLELGRYSAVEHERIGALAAEFADVIVAVGIRARAFAAVPGRAEALLFDDSASAARALADYVHEGDVLVVKGSQSVRMERVVKALLADPQDTPRLVRQEKKWLAKA